MSKNEQCTYYTFKNWMVSLCGSVYMWPLKNPPTVKALRQSVIRLSSRLRKERNSDSKDSLIGSFLEEEYCLPKVFVSRGKLVKPLAVLRHHHLRIGRLRG